MQCFATMLSKLMDWRETFYSVPHYKMPQCSAIKTPPTTIKLVKNTNTENGQAGKKP